MYVSLSLTPATFELPDIFPNVSNVCVLGGTEQVQRVMQQYSSAWKYGKSAVNEQFSCVGIQDVVREPSPNVSAIILCCCPNQTIAETNLRIETLKKTYQNVPVICIVNTLEQWEQYQLAGNGKFILFGQEDFFKEISIQITKFYEQAARHTQAMIKQCTKQNGHR